MQLQAPNNQKRLPQIIRIVAEKYRVKNAHYAWIIWISTQILLSILLFAGTFSHLQELNFSQIILRV